MTPRDAISSIEMPPSGLGIKIARTGEGFTITWARGFRDPDTICLTVLGMVIAGVAIFEWTRFAWRGIPTDIHVARTFGFALPVLLWAWWLGRRSVSFEFKGDAFCVRRQAPLYRSTETL